MLRVMCISALAILASACADASASEPAPSGLVSIVVAGRDLPAGTVLTFEDLMQRAVPEELVTTSIARHDSASFLINSVLVHPLLEGDPVQWSFTLIGPKDVYEGCVKLVGEDASAQQQVARARQLVLLQGANR
jgi:Flp pilus assembly protein CpaB